MSAEAKMFEVRFFVLYRALLKHPCIGRVPGGHGALPGRDRQIKRREMAAR